MKPDRPMQFLCAGVALSAAGFGIALMTAAMLATGYQASYWPTTSARIIRSEVETSQKGAGFRRGAAMFRDFYDAKIEYEYEIDGKTYIGDQIAIGTVYEGFDPHMAETAVNQYPLGSQVTISYDPRQPDNAVIDTSFSFALWWSGFAAGLATLVAGVVAWVKAVRMDDARRRVERAMKEPQAPPTAVGPARNLDQAGVASQQRRAAFNTVPVRMHWLLKTMAVLTGLVFFFLGSFALPLCITLENSGTNEMERAGGVVAQIIVIAITGSVLLFGAFLIWIGMKGSIRVISFRPVRS